MEGVAQVRHWTPKDDAKLIFAMEKGASFESLARGAVRFSQRYTLTELQDRWRILLYSPDAFAEASIQMVAREGLFPPGGSQSSKRGKRKRKESKGLSRRRKSESVYHHYMKLRKKISVSSSTDPHAFRDPDRDNVDINEEIKDMFPELFNSEDSEGEHGSQFDELENNLGYPPVPGLPAAIPMEGSSVPTSPEIQIAWTPERAQTVAQLSDSLMDLADSSAQKSYLENFGCRLLENSEVREYFNIPGGEVPSNMGESGPSHQSSERQVDGSSEENCQSSAVSMNRECPEYCNGVICCILNTEDTEIPDNDDVFLTVCFPPSSSPVRDIPTLTKANNFQAGSSIGKSVHPEHAITPSHHPVGSYAENQVMDHNNVLGFGSSAPILPHNKLASIESRVPKPDENHSSDSESEYESDIDDLPYASDVEAMVLEMDLPPRDDLEPDYVEQELEMYQSVESMRNIMRLEQSANASFQRQLEANEALAVFYGRHLKHYIKKPEVVIGRASKDNQVDIDLWEEGKANRISRRQALIRLRAGTFCLHNFGNCPIYVNDKEVAPKQVHALPTDCLIQVRHMSFIFEINHSRVQRLVDNVNNGSVR